MDFEIVVKKKFTWYSICIQSSKTGTIAEFGPILDEDEALGYANQLRNDIADQGPITTIHNS